MKNHISTRINEVKQLIDAMGHEIDWIDNDLISVDNGLWQIVTDDRFPQEIYLSFHVNTCPIMAASISKRLSYLTTMIGIDVVVGDVYAFDLDEDGKVMEVTFGQDAYKTVGRDHYYGLGR
jgi:hypothetical protein